jgi:hypothetical protein
MNVDYAGTVSHHHDEKQRDQDDRDHQYGNQ